MGVTKPLMGVTKPLPWPSNVTRMPRPRRNPGEVAVAKSYRLTPTAIAALRTLRRGAESDSSVIERLIHAAAGSSPDLGNVVATLPLGESAGDGVPAAAPRSPQRPARRGGATPEPSDHADCTHPSTTPLAYGGRRRCDLCGVVLRR